VYACDRSGGSWLRQERGSAARKRTKAARPRGAGSRACRDPHFLEGPEERAHDRDRTGEMEEVCARKIELRAGSGGAPELVALPGARWRPETMRVALAAGACPWSGIARWGARCSRRLSAHLPIVSSASYTASTRIVAWLPRPALPLRRPGARARHEAVPDVPVLQLSVRRHDHGCHKIELARGGPTLRGKPTILRPARSRNPPAPISALIGPQEFERVRRRDRRAAPAAWATRVTAKCIAAGGGSVWRQISPRQGRRRRVETELRTRRGARAESWSSTVTR